MLPPGDLTTALGEVAPQNLTNTCFHTQCLGMRTVNTLSSVRIAASKWWRP